MRGTGRGKKKAARSLTQLVELEQLVLGTELVQEILAGLAVRAVGLGEDDDAVLVDEALSLGFGGGHGGRRGAGERAEETLKDEGNGGQVETKRNRASWFLYIANIGVEKGEKERRD